MGRQERWTEYQRPIYQFSEREPERQRIVTVRQVRDKKTVREKEIYTKVKREGERGEKKSASIAKRKRRTSTLLDFPTYSAGSLIRGDAV